jgi:hypothetical protein
MQFSDAPGREVHVQMAKAATEQHDTLMCTLATQANALRSLLARWQEVDMRIALDGFPPDSSDRRNAGKKPSGTVEVLLHLRTTLELHEGHAYNPEVAGIIEEVRLAMEHCKQQRAVAPAEPVRSSTLEAHLVTNEGQYKSTPERAI